MDYLSLWYRTISFWYHNIPNVNDVTVLLGGVWDGGELQATRLKHWCSLQDLWTTPAVFVDTKTKVNQLWQEKIETES